MHIVIMQIPIIPASEHRITNQCQAECFETNIQILLLQLMQNFFPFLIFYLSSTEFYYLYLLYWKEDKL